LQEKLNVGSKEVFKTASALAAGVAKRGETCGALTGAIMAIGTLVGREMLEDKEQLQISMETADRVYILFREREGERELVIPFARRFTKSVMVGSIDSLSLRRARPFTIWEATAEKDALRFVALEAGSLLKSFSISKEDRDSNHLRILGFGVKKGEKFLLS
jgi:Putative redox-active protein (C_GCAxxG_C_C)